MLLIRHFVLKKLYTEPSIHVGVLPITFQIIWPMLEKIF